MKILLIGGSTGVAKALEEFLVEKEHEVFNMCRTNGYDMTKWFKDTKGFVAWVKDFAPDVIINCFHDSQLFVANMVGEYFSDNEDLHLINIGSTSINYPDATDWKWLQYQNDKKTLFNMTMLMFHSDFFKPTVSYVTLGLTDTPMSAHRDDDNKLSTVDVAHDIYYNLLSCDEPLLEFSILRRKS